MSQLTDSLLVVSRYLYNWLDTDKNALGIRAVWYDIDSLVPTTPAIFIEPQNKRRIISNTGHMVENTFQVSIVLLHSRMASKSETNEESLQLAEAIEAHLHTDKTLGGNIIHSYINSVEQGSVALQKVLLRATALSWQGMSKTRI